MDNLYSNETAQTAQVPLGGFLLSIMHKQIQFFIFQMEEFKRQMTVLQMTNLWSHMLLWNIKLQA